MTRRTFLVTGASKGIGRALPERLARSGHEVIGLARREDDASFPGTLVSTDLTDAAATGRTLAATSAVSTALNRVIMNVSVWMSGDRGATLQGARCPCHAIMPDPREESASLIRAFLAGFTPAASRTTPDTRRCGQRKSRRAECRCRPPESTDRTPFRRTTRSVRAT